MNFREFQKLLARHGVRIEKTANVRSNLGITAELALYNAMYTDGPPEDNLLLMRSKLAEAAQQIEYILPLIRAQAKESGDIAGIEMNAVQFLSNPFIVYLRMMENQFKENS